MITDGSMIGGLARGRGGGVGGRETCTVPCPVY